MRSPRIRTPASSSRERAKTEYVMRPRRVQAMQFDGTAAGIERLVAWMQGVAPHLPARPRTEYMGWTDSTGYLELEVMGLDRGAMAGDWIVVTGDGDRSVAWIVEQQDFDDHFETVG